MLRSDTFGTVARVIRAIIFDFNGVIADDETPHIACFQKALAEAGLGLTSEEYYDRYGGMDERTCTRMLLQKRDGSWNEAEVCRIAERKAELFRVHTALHKPSLFPGIIEFVQIAKSRYRIAIASGGRRAQIDAALSGTRIASVFDVIVAAEDCSIGKPDPAMYLLALKRLNGRVDSGCDITPPECLVLEDSVAGIRSAKQAGMRVLAVATTYPIDKLREADEVLSTLEGITPEAAIDRLP
ncbi:MAG TPA: HAD family phosphatase [Nitrospira sp.]|nr:HAD family phosphatase [Nitrospira sp.]